MLIKSNKAHKNHVFILKGIKNRNYLKMLSWLILFGKKLKILPLLAKLGLRIAIQGNSLPINTTQDLKKLEIGIHRTKIKSLGLIGLYTGCIMNEWFINVHRSTIRVLNKLGYDVFIPEYDVCCGALHSHSGDLYSAVQLKTNSDFQFINCEFVVVNSAGCCAELKSGEKNDIEYVDVIEFLSKIVTFYPSSI